MTTASALDSPVFRFYIGLATALLALAGAIILLLRWRRHGAAEQAWRAYRGWLIMIPLVTSVVFLGRAATIMFVTVLACAGFKEFARATGLHRDWLMTGTVYAGVVTLGVISLVDDPHRGVPGWYGLFMALPVFVIAGILIVPIARNRSRGQLQALALAIVGFVYFGWMFGHLAFLANSRHAYSYLLFLIVAVELNDVVAFTAGKLFGRRPLRASISPGKTLEGSMAAAAFSMILPWLLWFTFPHFGSSECVLAGLIVGVGGQLGDLAISVIKRDIGIKDMGAGIPGHGGVLDRIDSMIYAAPLYLHMVRWFHDLY